MDNLEDREFDKNMLKFASSFATLSKDHSTKVGFLLLKDGQTSPSIFSYNGLVSGYNDNCEVRAKTRPEKYLWGEHAERNGLYEYARKYLKDTMIFCSKFPNMDSARAIVLTGVDLIVTDYIQEIHTEYLKLIAERNRSNKNIHELDYSEDVKQYARVRDFFLENNVQVYHPSRKLAKEGSFLIAENRNIYTEDNNSRFLRKSIELLDQVVNYGNLFSTRNYKDAAFIVRKETFKSVSSGVHNVPKGFERFMTEEKENEKVFGRQLWYVEAVKDAIYNLLKPHLKGSRAYVSLCPCLDCAMALNAVGVSKVVTLKPDFTKGVGQRWEEHFRRTELFYKQVNMNAVYFEENEIFK